MGVPRGQQLDWGQNLPDLGRYLERNRIARIKTFIFGFDNPFHYLKPGSMDPQTLPAPDNPALARAYRPPPGLYAVSANFLAGFLFPQGYEDYLAHTFANAVPPPAPATPSSSTK